MVKSAARAVLAIFRQNKMALKAEERMVNDFCRAPSVLYLTELFIRRDNRPQR